MPSFERKTVVTGYKLRIKNKFRSVVEETDSVVTLLQSCVSTFNVRVDELLNKSDENFFTQCEKLNKDFEKYLEKLCFVHASFENVEDEHIDLQVSDRQTDFKCDTLQQCSEPFCFQTISTQTHVDILPSQASSLSSASYCSLYDVSDVASPTTPHKKNNDMNSTCCSSVSSGKNLENSEKISPSSGFHRESLQSLSLTSYNSTSSHISTTKLPGEFSNKINSQNLETMENVNPEYFIKNVKSQNSIQTELNSSILPSSISIPSVISATLTHVVNPDDFWMQLENSNGYIFSFSLSQIQETQPPFCIKPGIYCLAPFKSTPFYYRAKIMSEVSDDNQVEIFYIDHGSNQIIHTQSLKSLPKELYKIPMQVIHCGLSGILPINGAWTQTSIKKLKEFQNNTLELHIKAFKFCKDSYKYIVQLIATVSTFFNEDFSCDIAQALCLDGLAVHDEASSHAEESTSGTSNQISCDSGVSVNSNQLLNVFMPACSSNEMLINYSASSESLNAPEREILEESRSASEITPNICTIKEAPDLISFESVEGMSNPNKSNEVPECVNVTKNTIDENANLNLSNGLVGKCFRTAECSCELHLQVPPPSVMFVEKNMMLVMLSHIVNPNEFYINLAMNESITLDELRDQMCLTYESPEHKFHPLVFEDLKEGMYLAARFEQDESWYRIQILRVNSESKQSCDVFVQYIDYGNKAFVKYCNLRPLLPQFVQYPIFSLKCSLAGVTPRKQIFGDNESKSEIWTEESVKKFQDLVNFERCLTAQICEPRSNRSVSGLPSLSPESKPLEILLWDTEGYEDVLINEAFSESNLAEFQNNIIKIIEQNGEQERKEAEYLNEWDPMREEFEDIENSYGVCKEDPFVAISGYKPKDESYICRYFSLRGYCPKGSNCTYKHISLAEGGVTRDQEETFALEPTLMLPNPSSAVLVQVSAVVNPSLFYCILPFGNKTVDEVDSLVSQGHIKDIWVKDEMRALFRNMRKHYENAPFTENTTVALSYGSIVVAWRRVDCCWHRGRVLDVSDVAGPTRIFFVDFGDEDWVPRKKIREILPQYLCTPFQAIECHLSDVEPLGFEIGNKWSLGAIHCFKELVASEVLLAQVTYRCGHILHLTLRKTNKEDKRVIGDCLVKEGFAQYISFAAFKTEEASVYVPG